MRRELPKAPILPRDRLPEDYGPGQRQYDMAHTAAMVAEHFSYLIGVLVFVAGISHFAWWIALPAGVVAWNLSEYQYTKQLEVADAIRQREADEYSAHLPMEDL